MKHKKLILGALAAAVALSVSSCRQEAKDSHSEGLAKIACDESFRNIMQQEIEVFEYIYPKASIMPYYVDEKTAIDSLLALGSVKNVVISRELTEKERKYIKDHGKALVERKIAVDAIALVVNPKNDMDEPITQRELADILTGKITRWDQLGPSKMGKIDVVFEHQGASTVKYMRDSITRGRDFAPNVYAQTSPDSLFKVIEKNPNALGIIGVTWVSSDLKGKELTTEQLAQSLEVNDTTDLHFNQDVRVLKVRADSALMAYQPYQAYIFDGSYPLYRSIYMICVAPAGSIGRGFFSFVTGFQGQKLIQMTGILPATVRPRLVNVN